MTEILGLIAILSNLVAQPCDLGRTPLVRSCALIYESRNPKEDAIIIDIECEVSVKLFCGEIREDADEEEGDCPSDVCDDNSLSA